jgi:RNA polymerase sigma factor (sigma-70 family)
VAGVALRGPARLLSDERLAKRATGGDRRAFEEIFRRYHQDLYRFCLATVSHPQDAQEALQNTMVKVMRALPGEQREIKLKPWLFRIARNEAIETMRKRRDTVELSGERIAALGDIADEAGARARLRELFADLEQLPERQRSALVMRELAGLDFEEISEAFGTSPGVARQTLYEARQSLRQMDEGREMNCDAVRRALSDADGRVTRRRDIRAHVRACAGCRGFREDIVQRRESFGALAPLPLALSAGLLQGVLGGKAGSGAVAAAGIGAGGAGSAGGGLLGTVGGAAGQIAATSVAVKSAAAVAVVAAVGVGAAERGGVIDLPLPGKDKPAVERGAAPPAVGNGHEATGVGAEGSESRAGTPSGLDGRSAAGGRNAGTEGTGHAQPHLGAKGAPPQAHGRTEGKHHAHPGGAGGGPAPGPVGGPAPSQGAPEKSSPAQPPATGKLPKESPGAGAGAKPSVPPTPPVDKDATDKGLPATDGEKPAPDAAPPSKGDGARAAPAQPKASPVPAPAAEAKAENASDKRPG